MAIKVTDNTGPQGTKYTQVHTWAYGTCGVDKDGHRWARVQEGAIRSKTTGIVMGYSEDDLTKYNHCIATIDPNLSLELIFTKGK